MDLENSANYDYQTYDPGDFNYSTISDNSIFHSSNDWHHQYPYTYKLVLIVFSVSALVGMAENFAVGVLIFTRKGYQSPSNFYILNRAISDFLIQCPIPLVLATWVDDSIRVGGILCLFFSSAVEIGFIGSAAFLMFLSYDCYISRRFESMSRWKVLLRATVVTWLAAGLLTIPVYWLQKDHWETTGECKVGPIFHMVASSLSLPILLFLVLIPVLLSAIFLSLSLKSKRVMRSAVIFEKGKFMKLSEAKKQSKVAEDGQVKKPPKDSKAKQVNKSAKTTESQMKIVGKEEVKVKASRNTESKPNEDRMSGEFKKDNKGSMNRRSGKFESSSVKASNETEQSRTKTSNMTRTSNETEQSTLKLSNHRTGSAKKDKGSRIKCSNNSTVGDEVKKSSGAKPNINDPNVETQNIKGTKVIRIDAIKISGITKAPTRVPSEVSRSLIAALTLTFFACQVPYWTYHFCYFECGDRYNFYLETALSLLLQFNQVINPLVWLGTRRNLYKA